MSTLGDTNVGAVVYLRVDGTRTPFRVMHHGAPGSNYGDSYLGGTILCLDYSAGAYTTKVVTDLSAEQEGYGASYLHQDLNQNFLAKLDPAVQEMVMEVRLPYRITNSDGTYGVAWGSEGLPAKVWAPSLAEACYTVMYSDRFGNPYVAEGAKFDYWKDVDGEENEVYLPWICVNADNFSVGWSTRTPNQEGSGAYESNYYYQVTERGVAGIYGRNNVYVFPCLVLPDGMALDGTGMLQPVESVSVKVGGIWQDSAAFSKQNGIWTPANMIAAKVGGVWKK